ncbi:sensor domain-containing diguanylate cyclase [Desulfomarina sp.]
MKKPSTRNRLLFLIAAILFCSFVGISSINYMITRASVRAEILQNDLPLTMDNIYSELTSEMMRPLLVSSSMASDHFLKDWVSSGEKDVEKVIMYLKGIKEKYDFFTTFFVSAHTGIYYRYNGIHKTVSPLDSHDVWYYDFAAQHHEYDIDVDSDEAAGNVLTIFINYKVVDSAGKLLGVTGVGLKVEHVSELIGAYKQKYQRVVYLTDREGKIMVHPQESYIEKVFIGDMEGIGKITEEILATGNEPKNYEFERGSRTVFLTVRFISSFSWFLLVEQDESRVLSTARRNFIRTIILGLVASVFVVLITLGTINKYQEELETLAVTDELTSAANRRSLEKDFENMVYSYSRGRKPFSLILMDLDRFKNVNDKNGHLAGDNVLRNVAQLIKRNIRPTDTLARWGGDEFAVLCCQETDGVMKMAERIRQAIRMADLGGKGSKLDDPENLITVSCGVTSFHEGDDLDTMLSRADRALHRCKKRGGNCLETEFFKKV